MHARAEELQLYVEAKLPQERASWLEEHCERCADCARAVMGEAALELSLQSMSGERRCGMRADELVVELPAEAQPKPRPLFFALAAAAVVALAFVAARLPSVTVAQPAPQQLFADAGDLAAANAESPSWATGELSGGTR